MARAVVYFCDVFLAWVTMIFPNTVHEAGLGVTS